MKEAWGIDTDTLDLQVVQMHWRICQKVQIFNHSAVGDQKAKGLLGSPIDL